MHQFSAVLKKCLQQSGFQVDVYKSHSFRTGQATNLLACEYLTKK